MYKNICNEQKNSEGGQAAQVVLGVAENSW